MSISHGTDDRKGSLWINRYKVKLEEMDTYLSSTLQYYYYSQLYAIYVFESIRSSDFFESIFEP